MNADRLAALPPVGSLDELRFDNDFTAALPADPDTTVRPRPVLGAAFSRVPPTPVPAPRTLCWSREAAELLRFDPSFCESDEFAEVFSGSRVPSGADPFAMAYGGHQFGNWAGQLGDGRAIALGEVLDCYGARQTLQLKGAGPTPYSRNADGRAVLRSSIREFLCSEAMHHLGIPTSRALSLVATGAAVVRDMLYDGHPRAEPGAVVCRVAPSFVRFGNFQLPAWRDDVTLLQALVAHTIRTAYPDIWNDPELATLEQKVVAWYRAVVEATAQLVVEWMRVGFVHGVLNTDNMSILGLTIDYGPYGWLESFEPDWTPNTTDAGQRRYRFAAQPSVVGWNLAQLANALVPLVADTSGLQDALDAYGPAYNDGFAAMTARRLGWGAPAADDSALVHELYSLLTATETDYVLFFRFLADVRPDAAHASPELPAAELIAPLRDAYYAPPPPTVVEATAAWLRRWARRAAQGGLDPAARRAVMQAANPRIVLRNWIAQEVIDAAEAGDAEPIGRLLDALRRPYDDHAGHDRLVARRPEWARHRVGCSMLSCSS